MGGVVREQLAEIERATNLILEALEPQGSHIGYLELSVIAKSGTIKLPTAALLGEFSTIVFLAESSVGVTQQDSPTTLGVEGEKNGRAARLDPDAHQCPYQPLG